MSQKKRILIAALIVVLIVVLVIGFDFLRGQLSTSSTAAGIPDLPPGSIPVYADGQPIGGFTPDDLSYLEEVSFVDEEEGKEQSGWLLKDVLLLIADGETFSPTSMVTVTSSSRAKSVDMTWAEIEDTDNMVMFDLSGKGTLKLVSRGLSYLDVRDEWVQDVDRIEIETR